MLGIKLCSFYGSRINVASCNTSLHICADKLCFCTTNFSCTILVVNCKVFKSKAATKSRCDIVGIQCCLNCDSSGTTEWVVKRSLTSPHHHLQHGTCCSLPQRSNPTISTIPPFVKWKARKIKKNEYFIVIYIN